MMLGGLFKTSAIVSILLVSTPVLADEEAQSDQICDASRLDSKPGRDWEAAYGWRYNTSWADNQAAKDAENLANRQRAYEALLIGQSPWPDWYPPQMTALQPGTLFQMAMSPTSTDANGKPVGQPDDRPGGFGTFDMITSVEDVREYLAVIRQFKEDVDRINTYRVTEPLPVLLGPIGPQIDAEACELLPGRYSQFQMIVPKTQRMTYVEFVSSRPVN